ncbi:DNA adenine methylase [Prevotella sp. A2931]|uniref:site-specific DNA-methyltransferase (adenine-specific) n=1 Tax=Prevotella illustrans TaxID=2800387 RepID=A0ABS3M7M9_9BACT|nr:MULTISPECIES: DNA adenine methylase [Prevotella]MBO1364139.1 DNA adenine methylase [Prevotella illustrans]PTL26940.1 DNA methyltransferase [Prevotella sp. oral taxon 820]
MLNTFNISNRRYLGNKYKLLDWIKDVVNQNCKNIDSFFDVFSGTGSVASAFIDKRLVVCDMMRSNYLAALCWFSPGSLDRQSLSEMLEYYNNFDASKEDNYMSQNFSNTYFDHLTCQKIGYIRDHVLSQYEDGHITEREYASIITSLFYAMDRISHTCGHYDSFIRDGKYEGTLELRMPENDYPVNENNRIFCEDSNLIAGTEEVDVAYLDPPYNSRQYCDAYHLLENIALWNKPEVYGLAKKMDRTQMKSKYCKSIQAAEALSDLVSKLRCRYILFSYNNTGKKLQCRSNAKLTDEEIIDILSTRGDVQVFSMNYRGFDAGKSEMNKDNKERLFLCNVHR